MIPIFSESENIPSQVGELEKGALLESEDEDLGIQIRYQHGASKADVYLYDYGAYPLPTSVRHPDILEHFKECCVSIQTLAGVDFYQDVELKQCDGWQLPESDPDLLFLHAAFLYRVKDTSVSIDVGPQVTHLLLTTFKGYYLKVRYSYPDDQNLDRATDMQEFLIDLLRQLRTSP